VCVRVRARARVCVCVPIYTYITAMSETMFLMMVNLADVSGNWLDCSYNWLQLVQQLQHYKCTCGVDIQ